jgi:hypothetical protein
MYDPIKTATKTGVQGIVVAAVGVAAVVLSPILQGLPMVQSLPIDVSVEGLTVTLTALLAAGIRAFTNWYKHRKD